MSDQQRRAEGDFGGPRPVEIDKEYEVQITEISRKGDGIARVQGFVIFVKNGQVGQNDRKYFCYSRNYIGCDAK